MKGIFGGCDVNFVGVVLGLLLAPSVAWAAGGGKTPGITVSVPASASAGQVISITVTPVNGAAPTWVAVGSDRGGPIGFNTSVPATFSYVVPLELIGTITIRAMGMDTVANAEYEANAVVQIWTTATLTSMTLHINTTLQGTWSKNMFLDYYMETQYINIEGAYSDGVTRDLSSPASGTSYTSQDTSIVKILPDGNLQAMGQGATTVTATNSGQSLTIPITVDFVDPDSGSRCGGNCTGYDLALTYSNPVILTPATTFYLPYSGAFTLPANATQMAFGFNNNSGFPQLGVARGIATWKLGGGSDSSCSVSFDNNMLPTDLPPYAVSRGTMTITLPPAGGKCVILTNIAGMPDSQADKFTITNPAP